MPDEAVFAAPLRADIPGDHRARVQGDAHVQLGQGVAAIGRVDAAHGALHGQRATRRALGVVVVAARGAEHRQDGVAEKLVDGAAVLKNDLAHGAQVAVEQRHHAIGRELFGEAAKAADVRHHDGHFAQVAAEFEAPRPLQDVGHDVLGQIAAEGRADKAFAALQLAPVAPLLLVPAFALDTRRDARLEQHRIEGLEQVIVRPGFDALDNARHVLLPGNHNHRCRPPALVALDPLQNLLAAQARHAPVQEHHIDSGPAEPLQRFLAPGGGDHAVPAARQVTGQQLAVFRAVVYGQNKPARASTRRCRRVGADRAGQRARARRRAGGDELAQGRRKVPGAARWVLSRVLA